MTSFSSYVKNAIAALATAGALTLGSASPAAVSSQGYKPTYSATSQHDSGYRNYIQSYIRGLRQNYEDLIPKERSFRFAYGEGSDSQMFAEAMDLYNAVMQNYMRQNRRQEVKHEENYHLVPFRSWDGSIYYTDLNGHGQLKIIRSQHGPMLIGPKMLFEAIGGRALGDRFIDRMEDGEFFYNRK